MDTEIIEAEVVPAVDYKLEKYAAQTDLAPAVSHTLAEAFRPVFIKAQTALADAAGVAASVKDATCVTEIKRSRACRLAIRAVRIEGEQVHKRQKESVLRFGKAVDGFRNILLADLAPVEQALQDAEDTAERAEASRKEALRQARTVELTPLLDGPLLLALGELSETAYAKVLADARLLKQAKIDAAAKAEADRLAKEKADREERERIAAENARLQAEAAEARRLAEVERLRIEAERAEERRLASVEAARLAAKARREREVFEAEAREQAVQAKAERAKLQAELAEKFRAEAAAMAKADAEAKAAAMANRKAKAAPDKVKLLAFADVVAHLDVPTFADEPLDDTVRAKVRALASWLAEEAVKL